MNLEASYEYGNLTDSKAAIRKQSVPSAFFFVDALEVFLTFILPGLVSFSVNLYPDASTKLPDAG